MLHNAETVASQTGHDLRNVISDLWNMRNVETLPSEASSHDAHMSEPPPQASTQSYEPLPDVDMGDPDSCTSHTESVKDGDPGKVDKDGASHHSQYHDDEAYYGTGEQLVGFQIGLLSRAILTVLEDYEIWSGGLCVSGIDADFVRGRISQYQDQYGVRSPREISDLLWERTITACQAAGMLTAARDPGGRLLLHNFMTQNKEHGMQMAIDFRDTGNLNQQDNARRFIDNYGDSYQQEAIFAPSTMATCSAACSTTCTAACLTACSEACSMAYSTECSAACLTVCVHATACLTRCSASC